MEQGDVRSHFEDLSGSSMVGNFTVPGTGAGVRLKGFWYACVAAKRGKITVKDGSASGSTLLEFIIAGNLASDCGIVNIPGNGIYASDGLYFAVTDDEGDDSGGARSVTVFYQG